MTPILLTLRTLLLTALASLTLAATAQEATIRKNLSERLPDLEKIQSISNTPMNGLFEVLLDQNNSYVIYYTDAGGNFLIRGPLFDTRSRANLTEQRVEKLSALAFDQLPLKDAFTIVRGNGKRKLAIFEDPNCGFCKRFGKELAALNDITIHVFLYPILGPDSQTKAQNIWCARNKAKAFEDWMQRNVTPPNANCDTSALKRNVEFGQRNRITGTPTTFMADGTRVAGAVGLERIEQMLAANK